MTGNSLRLRLAKCNQRYLPCKAEITTHLCCVRQTPDLCKALRHSRVLWSWPSLLPPQTQAQVSAVCSCLQSASSTCLNLRWSHSHCWGLAAGILVAALTNVNEMTTFLQIDMRTPSLSICTATLLALLKRRTVLKNKGRNYWFCN